MEQSGTPALHTDHYELTMLDAAIKGGTADRFAVFESFARSLPAGRHYGVVGGVNRAIDAIMEFRFDAEQVEWLLGQGIVSNATADYLLEYRFSGTVAGYREGDVYFANSPILRVEGTFGEAVVLETLILSILNYDTAVASTASRMVSAAQGRRLIEMGSRRTNEEAAVYAARAAFIAGFDTTSNLEAGYRFGVPTAGTAAHASIMAHEDEMEAFMAQIDAQGVGTTILVDTYDIETGIENAVKATRRFGADGPGAIRIDSGDLLEESVKARAQLDAYGCDATKIVVSGDLDEYKISALVARGAPIDGFGVGTRLVAGQNCPSPGMVYKLVSIQNADGTMRSVAKRSASKGTIGGRTYAYRASARYLPELGPIEAVGSHTLGDSVELHTKEDVLPLRRVRLQRDYIVDGNDVRSPGDSDVHVLRAQCAANSLPDSFTTIQEGE